MLLGIGGIMASMSAHAEGTYQVGLNQPFVETNATAPGAASTRDILVDIVSAGEVINISACGAADTNTLAFVIETPSGAILPTYTPTALSGKILCANALTAPITTPYRYTTTVAGRYKVRLINVTAANFNRFDVTVTANATINPDPTNATGINGRVSSLSWQYSTGAFSLASATNADYYVLTPGGSPGTNYVWQLDLNALAGNAYSISANNKGVEAPRSGFSTDVAGNSVVAQFQNYLNYPAIAGPPPSSAPAVTGFRFIDNAGQDYGISPGNTAGVQDSGFFQFTAPVDNATYSISIDVNKNGIFGDAGDVRLTGNVANGFNSVPWDGKNNSVVVLPIGSYQARAEVRLGEFHFIANDVETSGGTQNGLTVYEATSSTARVSTRVYWDDITVLGVAAGGTANTPLGAVSGTATGYHTWGTFDAGGGGFGNNRFVDTFAFGATTQASLFVAIVGTDAPLTGADGAVTITPTSKPGDTLALLVTDADLNSLSGIIETVLVSVRNNVTGEMEAVTLTETGANTGIFTGSVPTIFGTVAGPNNNGALSTQATDTITVTYNDALTAAGTAVARTANDTVSGGITGTVTITPTSSPGDTLAIGVNDADLNANALVAETVVVTVVNSVTGESELVTLTETGPNTGIFAGTLATTAGIVAGTNNDGVMNVKAADTVVVTYADARTANGGPGSPTATNTTNSYNPLVATNDIIAGVDATLGVANVINAYNGDVVNLLPATSANAVLSIASGSSVPVGLTFNIATGEVGVVAGTTAATYSFVYKICEAANLLNCKTATVSVTVLIPVAPIAASDDTATGVDGVAGAANILNAFAGDTVNNVAATSANGILSVATGFTVPTGLSFDTATGNISVVADTAPGTYSFDYQLCEAANPTNCDIATISVTIAAPPVVIVATLDSVTGVDGVAGAANVVNAFTGDTVGGAAATSANSVLSVATGFAVPAALTFDIATGNVSVVAGTAAGTYSFDYQICESGNPANCRTATISVTVGIASSVIVATGDTASGVNGASGAASILNAFTGDTVGGAAATNANAILSVAPGFNVPAGLIFDTGTGNVSVAAGTAAGTYSFDYQICEALNPTNCQIATASITVIAASLVATPDSVTGINGASGAINVANAFTGDTINGAAATSANTTLSVATGSSVPSGLIFDPASGNVSVAAGTPAGTYTFDYQICENLNPANCQTATVSVIVDASAIVVTADSVSGINGASGSSNVVNAFSGDTVNGAAATSSNALLSVATGSAVPAGLAFDTVTGNVSVASGTAAGTYTFDYQICEALNPSNCQVATISVTVAPSVIVATVDSVVGINGANGTANALNVLAGDTVNGNTATTANAILSVAAGSSVPAALTFDTATGIVGISAGTPAGTYSFDYQICEALNPTNCRTATVSITVDAAPLVATTDSATGVNGASGASNVANAFTGDTINGAPASAANTTLSIATGSSIPSGLTFDIATGNVSVAAGTPAGTYTFDYQICENLNPANCQTATISIVVVPSALVVTNVSAAGVNGATGAAAVVNVLSGSTVNGTAANTGNAIIAVATGSSVPAGLVFDTMTGNISVAAGTAAGTYSFDYQICEALNPTNCQIATASITVIAASLVATPDSVTGINGASGAINVANAFTGDTINGAAATSANTTLSVATGSSVPSGLIFDPASGNVSVAAGTPAGTYTFDYQICENLNPANCQTATVSVIVDASAIVVTADSVSGINGASGSSNVVNAFSGDTVNGAAATSSNALLSVATGSAVPAGLAFDTVTGNVSVASGTAAGTYTFDYQICEALNPTNCQTATASVTTVASPLSVNSSSVVGINGADGASDAANVLTGNSVNGQPATTSNAILSIAPGSSVPAGFSLDNATGRVSIAAGTPAGNYVLTYQICEALNPANCSTASINFTVDAAPLLAANDSIGGVNGTSGASNVLNILVGDSLNGAPANTAIVAISLAPGSTVPSALTFDTATGNVGVAAGTPAGTYAFDYQICELLNPANCKTANVSVTVDAAPLIAAPDSVTGINGASGASNVVNAFNSDTLNGAAATPANSVLSVAAGSSVPAGIIFDAATGNVSVAAGLPAGTYVFDYQICELLNPTNCRASTVSISVVASAVIAVDDSVSGIDGANGAANVLNVFTGDTVNGAAANTTNAILSLAPGASVPTGIVFDVANGLASVAAGTPAGTYSFDYQICEALNPANCQIATATVTVINPAPVAVDDATTVVRGQSVKINVLANDSEPGGETLRVTTVTSPANGSAVINADGTIDYTPNSSFVGTDSFTYTICDPAGQCSTATVTITVHPSVSALTGTVFLDIDGNRAKDPTDPRQSNWLVEIARDGVVVATVRTDANGNYRVSDLPLGAGYSVVFRHPTSNVVYGRTDGVTLNPGITAVDLDRPIDPSGVVYDSVARTAIAGARPSIVDANGTLLPVACLLDASQQGQNTGADGRYRFDIVPGGAAQCPSSETVYRLVVVGPADTVPGNSTVILSNAGPFDPTGLSNGFVVANIAAPQAGEDTRYFFNFRLASGDPDVVNNHIPLDRAAALNPLVVTKTSVKRTANVGDLVPYTIIVRNTQNIARNAVDIVDLMPAGFKYVANTGRVDANAVSPVANGRELNWQNLNLPANGSLTVSLVLTVGSGVNDGDYVNIATGRDARNGRVISNEGQATVRIMPSPLFDCGEIIGKVFDDRNGNGYQDDGEPGIAGARVATVNGLLITADQHGRYHVTCAAVPNARIGSNFILKLDPRSLPGGYQITTENPRVVRLTRGKISELNFGARVQKAITLELTDAAFETGGTALRAEWQGQLHGLIADVRVQPSTIRLHYAAASAGDALGDDRLKALADQIQLLWREAGEDSELIIERISAPAKPLNGKE